MSIHIFVVSAGDLAPVLNSWVSERRDVTVIHRTEKDGDRYIYP